MPAGPSSRPNTETAMRPDTVLSDRYHLERVLGQGGVGTVWRARDLQLDRDVAVKLLQPGVARDPAAAERFRREATTAASLSHVSLVTIYDVGEDDGTVYLVMELVDGPSLKDVLARTGPLDPGEVAALGHRVSAALSAVHERGLVHRDVKPGNVLLPLDGPPKLVDFGTVHVLGDGAATLTTPGTMMGTIGYVAPEQFDGHEVTPRADVYAVGLLLHECLTGEPTFGTGTIAELMRRRIEADAEPPSHHRPGIPPELDEIVVRATLRDPAQRFADAPALAAALAPLVPGDGDGRLRALARQHAPIAPPRTEPLPVEDSDPAPPPTSDPSEFTETTALPRADDDRLAEDTGPRRTAGAGPVVPPGPDETLAVNGGVAGAGAAAGSSAPHDATSVLSPTPTDDAEVATADRPSRWPLALIGLAVVVLAILGVAAMNDGGGDGGDGGDDGGGGADTGAVAIVDGDDLDPFGGDGEHPEDVPRAFDGDPGTRWQTQMYNNPSMDKPGVGMYVEADGDPRRAEIDLDTPGATLQVYALDGPPPEGDPASWGDPVQTFENADAGTVTTDLPEGTKVVVLWFTELGPDGGRHRVGVPEIRLSE